MAPNINEQNNVMRTRGRGYVNKQLDVTTNRPRPSTEQVVFAEPVTLGNKENNFGFSTAAAAANQGQNNLRKDVVKKDQLGNKKVVLKVDEQQVTVELFGDGTNDVNLDDQGVATQDWVFKGRLLKVKGLGTNVVLKEVKCRRDSMNSGDVFILDTALNLYLWVGRESNTSERKKAEEFCNSVVKARGNRTKLVVLEEERENGNELWRKFWEKVKTKKKVMGVTVGDLKLKSAEKAGDDLSVKGFRKKLYRLSDEKSEGQLKFTLVGTAKARNQNNLQTGSLESKDVFLLDDGFKIWVWIGKHASQAENYGAEAAAVNYLKRFNRPTSLPIEKIYEGKEPEEFKHSFGTYKDSNCSIS